MIQKIKDFSDEEKRKQCVLKARCFKEAMARPVSLSNSELLDLVRAEALARIQSRMNQTS